MSPLHRNFAILLTTWFGWVVWFLMAFTVLVITAIIFQGAFALAGITPWFWVRPLIGGICGAVIGNLSFNWGQKLKAEGKALLAEKKEAE